MAVASRQVPLGLRIGITVLLLGLYWFGVRIPLPFVHPERILEWGVAGARASLTSLGLNPLLTGFLLVEIGSVLLTPGHRLRAQGSEGRRQLNRMALGMSLALAFVQALSLALYFEHAPTTLPLVDQPGWLFRLTVTCTLTAFTAGIYLAGNFITAWGVGNGFCLLFLVDNLPTLLRNLHDSSAAPDDRAFLDAAVLAVISAVVLLRVQKVGVTEGDETLEVPLPAFPQSVAALSVAYILIRYAAYIPGLAGWDAAAWALPVGRAVLVCLFSLLFFSWLGTRRRFLADLPAGLDLPPAADSAFLRQFLLATGLLIAVSLLYWALGKYAGIHLGFLSYPFLLIAIATGLDLYSHIRFLSDHSDQAPAVVLELDNVHLAAYLERRLAAAGIPAVVQGYHARSLFLLFQPLFKMHLLVPAERMEEAERILLPEIEEGLRAF